MGEARTKCVGELICPQLKYTNKSVRFLRNPTDLEMAYWLTKYTNKGHNTCMLSKHFYISGCNNQSARLSLHPLNQEPGYEDSQATSCKSAVTDVEMLGKHACVVPLVRVLCQPVCHFYICWIS